MISSLVLDIAARFAPGLVRRLAGDTAGDIAERLLSIGRAVTGASSPEEIRARLDADAEAAAEFQRQAAALDAELERAYLADRQDARSRDLELAKLGRRNVRGDVLAFAAILGLIATIALAFFAPVPDGPARDLVLLLGGALVVMVKDVYQFEFGSSRGSKDKDEALALSQVWRDRDAERRAPSSSADGGRPLPAAAGGSGASG